LTSLINQIKGLIEKIDKFWDLIELGINLINEIRDLIKEIPKFEESIKDWIDTFWNQGLFLKMRWNAGVLLKSTQGFTYKKFKTSRNTSKIAIWIENGAVSWTNCSLPISASVSTVTDNVYVSA